MIQISQDLNYLIINNIKYLIESPTITDKSIQLIKNKKYIFYAHKNVNKKLIKYIIKFIFNLNSKKINILNYKQNKKLKMFSKKFILQII
jgi:ribosomal protein L23